MVAATSARAYFEINVEGITSKQEVRVYRIIHMNDIPITRKEGSVKGFMDASTFGARANALVKSGHLIECLARKCKVTGRMAGTLWTKTGSK